jgi:hypothetical protein
MHCVHQSCYRSEIRLNAPKGIFPQSFNFYLEIGNWYCERCRTIKKKNLNALQIKCKFCPELKGIIKRVQNVKNTWSHIACVNWIP